ncbi:MAG: hypothetical protein U9R01_06345, partial [candidate division WOR-3 bacterium]|nr:hypothetical protein [candidate division WOR-3 bacterium]
SYEPYGLMPIIQLRAESRSGDLSHRKTYGVPFSFAQHSSKLRFFWASKRNEENKYKTRI